MLAPECYWQAARLRAQPEVRLLLLDLRAEHGQLPVLPFELRVVLHQRCLELLRVRVGLLHELLSAGDARRQECPRALCLLMIAREGRVWRPDQMAA